MKRRKSITGRIQHDPAPAYLPGPVTGLGAELRKLAAKERGRTFVHLDYTAIEMRVAAMPCSTCGEPIGEHKNLQLCTRKT